MSEQKEKPNHWRAECLILEAACTEFDDQLHELHAKISCERETITACEKRIERLRGEIEARHDLIGLMVKHRERPIDLKDSKSAKWVALREEEEDEVQP